MHFSKKRYRKREDLQSSNEIGRTILFMYHFFLLCYNDTVLSGLEFIIITITTITHNVYKKRKRIINKRDMANEEGKEREKEKGGIFIYLSFDNKKQNCFMVGMKDVE